MAGLTLQVIFDAAMGVRQLPSTEELGFSVYASRSRVTYDLGEFYL
jgi:hypothetical protein